MWFTWRLNLSKRKFVISNSLLIQSWCPSTSFSPAEQPFRSMRLWPSPRASRIFSRPRRGPARPCAYPAAYPHPAPAARHSAPEARGSGLVVLEIFLHLVQAQEKELVLRVVAALSAIFGIVRVTVSSSAMILSSCCFFGYLRSPASDAVMAGGSFAAYAFCAVPEAR